MAKFLKPMEQGTDFNRGESDFTNFEITDEFGTKITEDMKALSRKILENGFSKTGTYEDVISESGYTVNSKAERLKEVFDGCYGQEKTDSKTGYKNLKLLDDTEASLSIELSTIKIIVKCHYEYDYFFYMLNLVKHHMTSSAEFTYNLVKRNGQWEIMSARVSY